MPQRRKDAGLHEQEAATPDDEGAVGLERGDATPRLMMEQAVVSALQSRLHDPWWSIAELQAEFGDQLLGFAQALNSLSDVEVVAIDGERVTLTAAARRMVELDEL